MKIFLLVHLLFISSIIQAQDDTNIYIHTYDELEANEFAQDGVKAQKGSTPEVSYTKTLPLPHELKKLITKAELTKELQSMDQMELDLLASMLLRSPFDVVQKAYPEIDSNKLKKFLSLLQGKKK